MAFPVRNQLFFAIAISAASHAEFDPCKFNFGVDLQQASSKACGYMGCTGSVDKLDIPQNIDFIAKFTGHTDAGHGAVAPAPMAGQEGTHFDIAKILKATPVWYTYIIAEGAKTTGGLVDCNLGSNKTLCTDGAKYIQANRSLIISQYTAFAKYAAANWKGKMIWALEPDFYQYTSPANGNSSPLSVSYATTLLTDIVQVIKSNQPDALISMDISPWAPGSWFSALPLSSFDFMNTSGGVSGSGGTIKDNTTWSGLYSQTKLKMIADDGYGAAGALTSPNSSWWEVNNIKARMNDGVIGLMEAFPGKAYESKITALRAALPTTCSSAPKFALAASAGTGGSIALSPTGTSFDSGTKVTLTASAQTGYVFSQWSGDTTSTSPTLVVTMNKARTVKAEFRVKSTVKYTLTLSPTTNGSLGANPAGTSFDSGTVVQISAKPSVGYKFSSWSGDASGNGPTTSITMTSAMTVGAVFAVDNTPVTLNLTTGANGTVGLDPVQPTAGYVRGTSVKLTPTPAAGYDFVSWSGAVTGTTNPLTISMDSSISISAIFRKHGEVSNLVKNGDGSSLTGWTVSPTNGPTLSLATDKIVPSNSVFSTKGVWDDKGSDTTFMVTQQGIQLTGNTTYFLSYRAKVSDVDDARGAHPLGARIILGGTTLLLKADSVKQDSSWHTFTYSFSTTSAGSARLDLLLGNGGQTNWQSVLVDDIVISDVPPSNSVHRGMVTPLRLGIAADRLSVSIPAVAGRIVAEAVSLDGRYRTVLQDAQVAEGAFNASYSLDGMRPGVYMLSVRSGAQVYAGSFTVIR